MEPAVRGVRIVRVVPVDGRLQPDFVECAAVLLRQLVRDGAALGWVEPPSVEQVRQLLCEVVGDSAQGDACLVAAYLDAELVGCGYWRRYARPTHRPHADVKKLAVDSRRQGYGVGRALMVELVAAAVEANVEVLALDMRGDNMRAGALYESLGFAGYGRLDRFVAVGPARYDKVFYALDLREVR